MAFPAKSLAGLGIVAALTASACTVKDAGDSAGPRERPLQVGIFDEEQVIGHPDEAFPLLARLGPEVLRVNLRWDMVAPTQPADPSSHVDPAYDWVPYDQLALRAQAGGMELLFHIYGTPAWANRGLGLNRAPDDVRALEDFAFAAARRYSGRYAPAGANALPRVRKWAVWNEPNLSLYLAPSWERVAGSLVPVSAHTYASMCTAAWRGIHAAGRDARVAETVACGVTSPRGRGGETVHPLRFLREMKQAGARFDVYAHHPHARHPDESPSTPPRDRFTVTLANIDALFQELDRLYGPDVPVWITEYGYQTNPPDPGIGVSWETQAQWLEEAHEIVRENARIELFVWFLLKDEPDRNGALPGVEGWQSGLLTVDGQEKPAFATFRDLR